MPKLTTLILQTSVLFFTGGAIVAQAQCTSTTLTAACTAERARLAQLAAQPKIAPAVITAPKLNLPTNTLTSSRTTTTSLPSASTPKTATPATQTVTKPKATVTAVINPFVKTAPVVFAPRIPMSTSLRATLFSSANAALTRNPNTASLPACAAGQDGNCIASAAERKGTSTSADQDNDNVLAKPIERRRALVIGNTEYASPMASLPGTAKDAADISKALKDQGFDVVSLTDASREGTVRAFNNLIRTAGEDDSIIIYYAGHGHIHPGSSTGYWLPSDADAENPQTWISNADISRMLTNISAKQILLVSDSCFSGALTREADAVSSSAKPISANAILKRRSVAVMSSGSEEPVADSYGEGNSPFADALLKRIGNLNASKEPLRAFTALEAIRDEVSKISPQTPQYGVLMSAGHITGGDYLFGIK